ncbi:conserved protein, unknown function [Hepatocystis sp. ex Piliocolobus tephrosceles]|nr:conserved protein, unknown function [Hepatocystis sp. ex Piliocolobus tephrosceles]
MGRTKIIDAGCFISQMNELLLIDPLYMNYAITNYFNNYINDKKELLPNKSLNCIYFPNAKPGMWSSFAIKENSNYESNSLEVSTTNSYDLDRNYNNEMVISFFCVNNSDFMHEYITTEKINGLKWQIFELNENHLGNELNKTTDDKNTTSDKNTTVDKNSNEEKKKEIIPFENYFTNVLTIESGQVGLFCIESIRNSANNLLQKYGQNSVNNKEELENLFMQNMNDLYPWFDKICNVTISSSIAIIDYMNMPVGSVCISSSDCVINYLCEVVKDEITGEVWAIRVNFLHPLK